MRSSSIMNASIQEATTYEIFFYNECFHNLDAPMRGRTLSHAQIHIEYIELAYCHNKRIHIIY
jgi:hypothetical protein